MALAVNSRDQVRALTRAFLSRYFESEITTTTDDLKGSFFWLLAALAMPGVFIPWLMVFDWHLVAMFQGADRLREASGAEKTFYLGFSMIASGLLTAIAWSSLLPDHRDTLILGTLPVKPRTVVIAKLAALAGYIAIVAVSMHAMAAFFFGAILSTNSPFLFLVRGMVAHFVAACAASAAVALWVAAAQGVTLAIVGPRLFVRLTTALQAGLVALIALGLAALPTITSSAVDTVRGFGRGMQPWILSTPPVWFLGLYEWILGTSDPRIIGLARTAGLALALPAVAIAIAYPLAYRRLMVAVVETGQRPGRSVLARASGWALVAAAGRHPEARATADFLTSSLARVERHRFVLAIALGVAVAWGLPGWNALTPTARLEPALLSLPLVAMMFLLVGLRVASALPADVRAAWLFDVHSPSRSNARQALERMLFVLGVLPPVLLSAPLYWWLWGSNVAAMHAVISVALGVLLIELLIWHCDGMPCGQRWSPGRLDLGRRWPFHLAVFLIVAAVIPRVERFLFTNSVLDHRLRHRADCGGGRDALRLCPASDRAVVRRRGSGGRGLTAELRPLTNGRNIEQWRRSLRSSKQRTAEAAPELVEADLARPAALLRLRARVPDSRRRFRRLPRALQPRRHAARAVGLRRRHPVRSDREEAVLPRPARGARVQLRDARLRSALLVLPELGDLAGAARSAGGRRRRSTSIPQASSREARAPRRHASSSAPTTSR